MKKKSVLNISNIHHNATMCKDGTRISIQASDFHFSNPKQRGLGEYLEFEVSLLDKDEKRIKLPALKKYSDECIYGYVPADLVQELINSFGGLASSPWPQFK